MFFIFCIPLGRKELLSLRFMQNFMPWSQKRDRPPPSQSGSCGRSTFEGEPSAFSLGCWRSPFTWRNPYLSAVLTDFAFDKGLCMCPNTVIDLSFHFFSSTVLPSNTATPANTWVVTHQRQRCDYLFPLEVLDVALSHLQQP